MSFYRSKIHSFIPWTKKHKIIKVFFLWSKKIHTGSYHSFTWSRKRWIAVELSILLILIFMQKWPSSFMTIPVFQKNDFSGKLWIMHVSQLFCWLEEKIYSSNFFSRRCKVIKISYELTSISYEYNFLPSKNFLNSKANFIRKKSRGHQKIPFLSITDRFFFISLSEVFEDIFRTFDSMKLK